MRGHRRRSERVLAAFAEIRLIPDISHVGDHLHDVAECRSILFKRALDLVESVFALGGEIALVKNVSTFSVLILCANAREKYQLAGADEGDSFGKAPFGPFAVIVIFLLEGLSRCDGWRDKRPDRKDRKG